MHVHNYEVSMGRFDEFVNFLFRTLKGRLALIGCTVFIACMCSGCYLCTCPAAMCENAGCEICADCFYTCDGSCGKSCDETCGCGDSGETTYGGGCCGAFGCGTCSTCGGCTCDTCGGCSSCGTCSGCGGCSSCEKSDPVNTIYTYYIAVDSEGNFIERLDIPNSYDVRESKLGDVKNVPYWNTNTTLTMYFVYDSAYDSFDNTTKTFGNLVADDDGVLNNEDAVKDGLRNIYVKLVERAAVGEDYTIHFEIPDEAGISLSPISVKVGDAVSGFPAAKDMPVLDNGNAFLYWRTAESKRIYFRNGEKFHPYRFEITDLDIRLIAVYGEAVFNVDVYYDNNTYTSSAKYNTPLSEVLSNIDIGSTSERTFRGWAFSKTNFESGIVDLTPDDVTSYSIKENLTLYAVYGKGVTITLHYTDGPKNYVGDSVKNASAVVGEYFTLRPPTPKGPFEFEGWYTSPDFGASTRCDSSIIVRENSARDYYANWTVITEHSVTYLYRRGDSYIDYRTEPYEYSVDKETDLLTLPLNLVPEGNTFIGWRINSPDTGDVIRKLPAGTYGRLRLYAVYEAEASELRMFTDGGTIAGAQLENGGYYLAYIEMGEQKKLPVPTKVGHEFVGWYKFNSSVKFADETGMMLAPYDSSVGMSLKAEWKKKKYTVAFENTSVNPTQVVMSVKVEYEEKVPACPSAPTARPGYEFDYWADIAGHRYSEDTVVTEHITYVAVFKAKEYTITLRIDGDAKFADGSTEKQITVKYMQENIQLPVPISNASHIIFNGWKKEGDTRLLTGKNGVLSQYTDAENITLVAVLS